jgi:TnpA family transposase
MPWERFSESVTEAETFAQPEDFDHLSLVGDGFSQLRRYTPALLAALDMNAAPAARDVLEAVDVLKGMNDRQARKLPDDPPTSFVRKRWESLVRIPEGLDRRFYELCVLSELKNALRAGDIWVQGSRQFKDFEEYLLSSPRFTAQREQQELGLAVDSDCECFLEARLGVLKRELATVERLAALADAINLGLTKMAESCPSTTYAKLSWLQAWHIRDETYSAALAELVNAQFRHPFAVWWGDGTTSSSDGQNFKAGDRGQFAGQVNPKYGSEPGVQFYTHISDQYAPFHTKVINATVRDATHVLDGLLYHESDLRIEEHYTDTAGFTDHVFALMHLLGFRFAPRIRDLADKRLYIPGDTKRYPTLAGLIGGSINVKHIRAHWDEILRLAASIQQGTVTASLMLRKLGSYPRQNGLAVALRELGRIERTLFTLDWLQNVELRRRVQSGLNKGEAKNALARAVFFNRLGELRDRRFENQRYRASGLNLVVAAIVLWNTVYLERSTAALREHGQTVDDKLLQHLSPLGWEHINLTGDYIWRQHKLVERGQFRPLRAFNGS